MYFAATLVTMMVQQWLPESLWFWCLRCYYCGGSGDTYGGCDDRKKKNGTAKIGVVPWRGNIQMA
ncbi:hypothetical protein Hanom_Chr05g00435491 [Helianthus anomalus]